jgi:hypothetical protein
VYQWHGIMCKVKPRISLTQPMCIFVDVQNTGSNVCSIKIIIVTHNVVSLLDHMLLLLSSFCFDLMHVTFRKQSCLKL